MQEVIPVKKRIYRRVAVKDVSVEGLLHKLPEPVVIVALDVAKHAMVAAFAAADAGVVATVSFRHPDESSVWLALLAGLIAGGKRVEVVMEPSGSYGDALRHQLRSLGAAVYRVGSKRTHDAAELFDAVPSMHDAKAAAVLSRLHLSGLSAAWVERSDPMRELSAALSTMELHQEHYLRNLNVLEALLARHWPELLEHLQLTSASMLALIARIGGPSEVAAGPAQATELLRGMSHGLMKPERIAAAVGCASTSLGAPMLSLERARLQHLAQELHRSLKEFKHARQLVLELGAALPEVASLGAVVGMVTAAVLVTEVGSAKDFGCAHAYVKALGLNLREKSSGARTGRPSLTKRGSSRARMVLWMAVLRWVQTDATARAWYQRKVERDGGRKKPALAALMRKLAKALYHVGRGEALDVRKLFDCDRLGIPAVDGTRSTRPLEAMEVAM
jgi:transposase